MREKIILGSIVTCCILVGVLLFANPASAAPAKPSNLIALAGSSTEIGLSWQDNSSDEDSFEIWRKVQGEAAYHYYDHVGANVHIYYDSGLEPSTIYYYKVHAHASSGYSDFSNIASDCTQALIITLTSPNGEEVWKTTEHRNITWTSDAEGYTVKISYKAGDGVWQDIATVPNTNSYNWTVPGLSSSQVRIRVYAYRLGSPYTTYDISDADFTIQPLFSVTAPNPPSNLSSSGGTHTTEDLIWQDNSSNEIGFKIERKTEGGTYSQIDTVAANETSYTDSAIGASGNYYYRICAYNIAGNSAYSNEYFFERSVQYVHPFKPTNLAASAESSSKINLSWQHSGISTGFEVERRTNSAAFTKIGQTSAAVTTYSDAGLQGGTNYTYRVRAYTIVPTGVTLYSDYSNGAAARTNDETIPPPDEEGPPDQTVLRFYIGSTEYYVKGPGDTNSQLETMDTEPITLGGRTLMPIAYVSQPLGAYVNWQEANQQVTIQLGSNRIILWINNGTASVNGVSTAIDPLNPAVTPIIVPPGRTLLPLSFIAANLGCDVEWKPETQEVKLTYPKS